MNNILPISVIMLCLVFCSNLCGVVPEQEILTNNTIRTLVKAGLSTPIIVNKIKASQCDFDISTNELLHLKAEKIPDEVVNAMVEAMQPKPVQTSKAPLAAGDPNNPTSAHPAGIYWINEKHELVRLQPSTFTGTTGGGMIKTAFTWGIAKSKIKAVLPRAHATLSIQSPRPTFYLYLSGKDLVTGEESTATPAEFILAIMESKEKDHKREMTYLAASMWGQASLDKYRVAFDSEEFPGRIFKITPNADLSPGEYGFYYAGTTPIAGFGTMGGMQGGKVFDFGIGAIVGK